MRIIALVIILAGELCFANPHPRSNDLGFGPENYLTPIFFGTFEAEYWSPTDYFLAVECWDTA